MKPTKKNFFPMKKFIVAFIILFSIAPVLTFAQAANEAIKKPLKTTEVKIILVNNNCTSEIKSENKTQNILDMLQKESEETVIYPLVQLAHRIREKVRSMDKKNLVSSDSVGTEGEAGGGPPGW